MSILNSLFIAGFIAAGIILAIDYFLNWRNETAEEEKLQALQKYPLPFPLIRGDANMDTTTSSTSAPPETIE
jgi:small neutral amino acid transporter SnatA (MarC family)